MFTELDTSTQKLLIITALFFGTIIFIVIVQTLANFMKELRYYNGEIRRTHAAERRHYIQQRKRLWLSLIPFVKR